VSSSKLDELRLKAASLLAEEDLSADSFKESVWNAGSMASTDKIGAAALWNTAMVATGVAVWASMSGWAAAAGVAWAVFNAYPLALSVWRYLS